MPTEELQLSRSAWVRQQVLQNPDITLEQLQAAYDKTDFPKKDRPKDKQPIHLARNQIRQRWGVDPSVIPHKTDGSLNITGLVRLFINRFGDDPSSATAIRFFSRDGIELKPVQYSQARANYISAVVAQPDANQNAGPRAGGPVEQVKSEENPKRKVKRRGNRRSVDTEEGSHLDKYAEIEAKLDKLIADAEAMKAWPLANDLRNARRRAGAGVLAHS